MIQYPFADLISVWARPLRSASVDAGMKSRKFKVEAVKLVKEREVPVAQASRDLDVHENVLRKWVKEFGRPGAGLSWPWADEARAG